MLSDDDEHDPDVDFFIEALYRELEHGDAKHRKWLRDKLYEFFYQRVSMVCVPVRRDQNLWN